MWNVDFLPSVLLVDASEAGAGNLEIIVRCASTGQRIPNFLEADDRSGKFRIFFTPKENCFRYRVDVTFNEQQVQGKWTLSKNNTELQSFRRRILWLKLAIGVSK